MSGRTFVLASNNPKKLAELRTILADLSLELLSQREAGLLLEAEETGATFEENAFIKAHAASEALGLPAIADDSGLCVDALGGAPGVLSARYTGRHDDTDEARCRFLLEKLRDEEHRAARFVSCICCRFPDGAVLRARGECGGEILREPRGTRGFGYDPVFLPTGESRSMAELSAEEKNRISHRGRALRQFREELRSYYAQQ
jgi:XTP/dITP diphosphohydrolase